MLDSSTTLPVLVSATLRLRLLDPSWGLATRRVEPVCRDRLSTSTCEPRLTWAPVAGTACQAQFATLDEFRQVVPGVEPRGRALPMPDGAVFRSPELRRFELAWMPEGVRPAPVAASLRQLLGWTAAEHLPGAY